ncbi:MAG: type II toxin-antitoxin system RelE/ParE family toxin [Bacteroidales bacterium]|nr:type II toxin-antitoxin system RelE/ParE family toxin [Bacteroidales bacterium]
MQINWSEQSQNDLKDILSYVGSNFGRQKAEIVLSNIRSTVELLKDFPLLGKNFVEDKTLGIYYRSLSSKLNQIVYYIESDSINIVAIWQNRCDINSLYKRVNTKKTIR